jgi:hypothetical protein
MKIALFVVSFAVTLVSCVPTPPGYGIPAQHPPLADDGTPVVGAIPMGDFMRADDQNAQQYIVRDVRGLEMNFRWTLAEPEFRFPLPVGPGARWLRMEFGINDRTIGDTGPLRMVFEVNGHVLDRPVFGTFGLKVFEKQVPEEWLVAGENRVQVRILNPWQSPDPAVKLGVVLNGIGLVKK